MQQQQQQQHHQAPSSFLDSMQFASCQSPQPQVSGLSFPTRQERKVSTSSITFSFTGQKPPPPFRQQPPNRPHPPPPSQPQQLQSPPSRPGPVAPPPCDTRSYSSLPRRFSNPAPPQQQLVPQVAQHQGPSPYVPQQQQQQQQQQRQPPVQHPQAGSLRLLQWLSSSSDMMDRDVRNEVWQKLGQPPAVQAQRQSTRHSASSGGGSSGGLVGGSPGLYQPAHQAGQHPQPHLLQQQQQQPMYQQFSLMRSSASTSDIADRRGGDTQSEAGDSWQAAASQRPQTAVSRGGGGGGSGRGGFNPALRVPRSRARRELHERPPDQMEAIRAAIRANQQQQLQGHGAVRDEQRESDELTKNPRFQQLREQLQSQPSIETEADAVESEAARIARESHVSSASRIEELRDIQQRNGMGLQSTEFC